MYMLPNLLTLNSNYNNDSSVSLQNLFLNLLHMAYFKFTSYNVHPEQIWGGGHLLHDYICHSNYKELTYFEYQS